VRPEVVVLDDPAVAAAQRLAEAAAKGRRMVLTGGSTPRSAYEGAAKLLDDWSAADIWMSDERCVPAHHEHSNFGMLKQALLDRVEGRQPAVHRMEGEAGPREGAVRYEEELRRSGFAGERVPVFDLMLLGLGADAHVCSLFPGDAALGERERWVVGVETPGMPPLVSRITLTLPVVNAAREVVFLVSGEDKAEAVVRALSGAPDPGAPASLVRPASGSLTLLLDPPAALRLEGGE
jgi:6-phosphogluconolactonase